MKSSGIDRRTVLSSLALLPIFAGSPLSALAQAKTDTSSMSPLASWNNRAAKQAILDFIRATTDQGSAKFVPPEERIATFDQDGTLWVEQPIYSQVMYCLDRVPDVVREKSHLKNVEPFKTVLSGDREAIAKLPPRELEKILMATLTGMSVETFEAEVRQWLATAKHPRWKRPFTDLTYQPMQEVLQYLRASGFKTYIVISEGSFFTGLFRYDVSFAKAVLSARDVSNLQIAPTLNIALPNRWFVTFYPEPDIRYNFGDPVAGQTGRLFLPMDVMVGKDITKTVTVSLEIGVPIVKDYPVYDFKTVLRVNTKF